MSTKNTLSLQKTPKNLNRKIITPDGKIVHVVHRKKIPGTTHHMRPKTKASSGSHSWIGKACTPKSYRRVQLSSGRWIIGVGDRDNVSILSTPKGMVDDFSQIKRPVIDSVIGIMVWAFEKVTQVWTAFKLVLGKGMIPVCGSAQADLRATYSLC